jgi:hypothetical protein
MYHMGERATTAPTTMRLISTLSYSSIVEKLRERLPGIVDGDACSVLYVLKSIGAASIKKKNMISEKEFIEKGFEMWSLKGSLDDRLENEEIHYYYHIIDNIQVSRSLYYVIRDVSGSIFQNACKILGVNSDNSLKVLNLTHDV